MCVCMCVCMYVKQMEGPYRWRRLLQRLAGCPTGRIYLAGGEPDAALPCIALLLCEGFPNFRIKIIIKLLYACTVSAMYVCKNMYLIMYVKGE